MTPVLLSDCHHASDPDLQGMEPGRHGRSPAQGEARRNEHQGCSQRVRHPQLNAAGQIPRPDPCDEQAGTMSVSHQSGRRETGGLGYSHGQSGTGPDQG